MPTSFSVRRYRRQWMYLAEPGFTEVSERSGDHLADGLLALGEDHGLPVTVQGLGTVFQIWFSDHPIRNWRDAEKYADVELFTRWYQEMLLRGVLFHPSQYENLFVSLVHDDADIDETLNAAAMPWRCSRNTPKRASAVGTLARSGREGNG